MSQFEFVSAFVSILFGLGLTLLLTGAIERFYQRRIEFLQVCYTIHALVVAIVAWWTMFQARDDSWTFEYFFITVLWALSMFGMCAALYPPGEAGKQPFEQHRRLVLGFLATMGLLDIVQTLIAGGWSWGYAMIMLPGIVVALVAILVRSPLFQRIAAIFLPVSLLLWALVGRRLLG